MKTNKAVFKMKKRDRRQKLTVSMCHSPSVEVHSGKSPERLINYIKPPALLV